MKDSPSPSIQSSPQSEPSRFPSQTADDQIPLSSATSSTPVRTSTSIGREILPASNTTFHATTTSYPLPPSVKAPDTIDVVSQSQQSIASPSSSNTGYVAIESFIF